jgi:acetylglutamate kinase
MKLNVIKIGGNVIDNEKALLSFVEQFATLEGPKILIHGGGKLATDLAKKLNVEQTLIDGRRITDAETLKLVTMTYAGFINVALLQAKKCNAIGLSGADANVLTASKRSTSGIDYGYVGDIENKGIDTKAIRLFIENGLTPVFCAITHDGAGQLLNTNADTIASCLAVSFATTYEVVLSYCFEKKGVLRDVSDEHSLIESINPVEYKLLKEQQVIFKGMIPKLDNAFDAINKGVKAVMIGSADDLQSLIKQKRGAATMLCS